MQLFLDEDLSKPLDIIQFGEVWFLEKKTETIWLYNETKAFLREIEVDISLEQLVKVTAPSTLKAKEKAPIILTWQPSVLEGLKAKIEITAVEVYVA